MIDEIKSKYPVDIRDAIASFTLFSPELTDVYNNKEYTLYTLRTFFVLDEITEEMEREMTIEVEKPYKKPDNKRGSRFDVLVSFPSSKINIEIQKLKRGDEIPRSFFYIGKIASNIDEGISRIPDISFTSLWLCDFDPFPEKNLPYYSFRTTYEKVDGIEGTDERFTINRGIRLIFVNGRYDWDKKERERDLTDREKAIKTYILDMKESRAENIRCNITRDIFRSYKEGGFMYDKLEEDMRIRYPDLFALAESNGREDGKKEVASNFLKSGLSISFVAEHSGLPLEVVEELATAL